MKFFLISDLEIKPLISTCHHQIVLYSGHPVLKMGSEYRVPPIGLFLSEGRGTPNPFLTLGDPSTELSDDDMLKLEALSPSLRLERTSFVPQSIPGVAPNPKHLGA